MSVSLVKWIRVLFALEAALWLASSDGSARGYLSFEDRINAQREIERVYYSHTQGSTKRFEDVIETSVLEKKVIAYLEETAALERLWGTEITAAMLEAELRRVERSTRFPERLQLLYNALDRDSVVIQECFIRPVLTRRLIRSFYWGDESHHRAERTLAEGIRGRLTRGEWPSGQEVHPRVQVSMMPADAVMALGSSIKVIPDETSMAQEVGHRLRESETSRVEEESQAFIVRDTAPQGEGLVRVYRIPKRPWEQWWGAVERPLPWEDVEVSAREVTLREPDAPPQVAPPCPPDDIWDTSGTLDDYPEAARDHTAVWTGTEMIVWGGISELTNYSGGLRYDPLIDQWDHTSLAGAPGQRTGHSAIWTGREMIIWGGREGQTGVNTGGRYNPVTDTWVPTSVANAPSPSGHTAVWTGSEMIVWGAAGGGRYDPSEDSWSSVSTVNAPSMRAGHTAVWTGSKMIIWGGVFGSTKLRTGALYDPIADSWSPTAAFASAPAARYRHSAVWTGTEMIVWGGLGTSDWLNSGGRYDPSTDSWSATSLVDAPQKRAVHSAVWTGQVMLIWGGEVNLGPGTLDDGGRYDPTADSWTPITNVGRPERRSLHSTVWTGSLMIVWGGAGTLNEGWRLTGGRYDPVSDRWTPTASTTNAPEPRSEHSQVWTGTRMIVWGGINVDTGFPVGSGSSYDPLVDAWEALPWSGAPTARGFHSAVWTGDRMLIWGGHDLTGGFSSAAGALNTGAAYEPIGSTWTALNTNGAPDRRERHTAVWTGQRMLAWGGRQGTMPFDSGSSYDPATDTWGWISNAGAPSPRFWHTAVWTGQEMIVWGGRDASISLDTGGRYDPQIDAWSPIASNGAPPGRYLHSGIWTGRNVLIWGGRNGVIHGTGARYDPATDSWSPISIAGAPPPRQDHSTIWTGREMIVWGGNSGTDSLSDGGRYNPVLDTWRPTSTIMAARARSAHEAVWTGAEMVLFGGWGPLGTEPTGGRYLVDSSPDDDLDSFTQCGGDCDDADASMYPSAPQICDGINNDCADPNWPAVPPAESDADQDGVLACSPDCNDADPRVWGIPGEATDLCLEAGTSMISWLAPQALGATTVVYDVLRSAVSNDFGADATCVSTDHPATSTADESTPSPGGAFFYLVRAGNECPDGEGALGSDSMGTIVTGKSCPDTVQTPIERHPLKVE